MRQHQQGSKKAVLAPSTPHQVTASLPPFATTISFFRRTGACDPNSSFPFVSTALHCVATMKTPEANRQPGTNHVHLKPRYRPSISVRCTSATTSRRKPLFLPHGMRDRAQQPQQIFPIIRSAAASSDQVKLDVWRSIVGWRRFLMQ